MAALSPTSSIRAAARLLASLLAVAPACGQDDEEYTVEGLSSRFPELNDLSERRIGRMLSSGAWEQIRHDYGLDREPTATHPLVPQPFQKEFSGSDVDYDDLPPEPQQPIASSAGSRHGRRRPQAEAQPDPSHFVPESVDQLTTEMSLDDSPKRLDPVAHARGQLAQAAPTDPSALTTLDHETASLARQEREELARQDTSPREEAAQNRLAGMLRLAPGGAKMFGSTLSGWLPASEDAG